MAGQVLFRLTELGQALAAGAEQPHEEQHRITVEACSGFGLSAGDVAAVRDELREGGEQTFEELTASGVAIVEASRCVDLRWRGPDAIAARRAQHGRSLHAWRCIQRGPPCFAGASTRSCVWRMLARPAGQLWCTAGCCAHLVHRWVGCGSWRGHACCWLHVALNVANLSQWGMCVPGARTELPPSQTALLCLCRHTAQWTR